MDAQAELLRLYEDRVGSVTDGLTGVYSHGIFQAFMAEECNRCNRYGEGFSLALIDVDFLGKLNAQKGPLEGDQVLKRIAAIATACNRSVDIASRYSDDLFAVLYPKTSANEAFHAAERIRKNGFAQNNHGVLILAATNVPWAVDSAFRRPGRFDRVLFVPPPDVVARKAILNALLQDRPTESDIDTDYLAKKTSGFSGADLRDLIETAVDEAIEESIAQEEEQLINNRHLKNALNEVKPTTLEWLTSARNYSRYANEGGQYDDVLDFLKRHGNEYEKL